MIDLVKRFFRKSVENRVAEHLERRCQNIQVATCAVLLEMARIDKEFSEEEQENLVSILKKRYGLSNEDAEELLLASDKELEGSIDLWRFTHLINRKTDALRKYSPISRGRNNYLVSQLLKKTFPDPAVLDIIKCPRYSYLQSSRTLCTHYIFACQTITYYPKLCDL